ncbi:hypothetical protein JTB14_006842 [Gonioctena quinquepunctata]|nr:hypothetical protein JTB14_006842 [Gonioctena quinquepunctata]
MRKVKNTHRHDYLRIHSTKIHIVHRTQPRRDCSPIAVAGMCPALGNHRRRGEQLAGWRNFMREQLLPILFSHKVSHLSKSSVALLDGVYRKCPLGPTIMNDRGWLISLILSAAIRSLDVISTLILEGMKDIIN